MLAVLLAEAVVLVVLVTAYLGVAVRRRRRGRRVDDVSQRVRSVVADVLEGGGDAASAADALRVLPLDGQAVVLAAYAMTLEDEEIGTIADELGLLDAVRSWTRSRRWWRRLHGLRVLDLLAHDDERIAELVHDRDRRVRAQAVQALDLREDPERVPEFLALIEDTDRIVRTAAKDALVRAGRTTVEPLADYLADPAAAAPRDAFDVAVALRDTRLLPVGLSRCDDPDPEVRGRAAELIAAIGGSEAAHTLRRLLDDDAPDVRAVAARGLGRLRHLDAAGDLAALLQDESWSVARTVAFALRGLGPSGILLLRRARDAGGGRAAEIAGRVLASPQDLT